MLEDRATQQRINQRRQGRHERERQESEQKNFATGLPPEARQAVITMIDHIVTPMLVDQWRFVSISQPCSICYEYSPIQLHLRQALRHWPAFLRESPIPMWTAASAANLGAYFDNNLFLEGLSMNDVPVINF